MNIERALAASVESWLAAEALTPAQMNGLTALVRRRARHFRRFVYWTGAAAAVLGLTFFGPLLVSLASDAPWVGHYITRMAQSDPGALWAFEHGMVVPVGKEVSGQGYTLRVESVLADAARTEIYYTVTGPDRPMPVWPQARFSLSGPPGVGGGGTLVEGKLIGYLTLPPLPHALSLVHVTLDGVGNVSFFASRHTLDQLTRIVRVERTWRENGNNLTVRRLLLTPTQTVIEMDGYTAGDAAVTGVELSADGQVIQSQGRESRPAQRGEGTAWRFTFDQVTGNPEHFTLRLYPGPFTMGIPVKP